MSNSLSSLYKKSDLLTKNEQFARKIEVRIPNPAAPQTALWGVPGSSLEPETGGPEAGTLTTHDHHTSLDHHSSLDHHTYLKVKPPHFFN